MSKKYSKAQFKETAQQNQPNTDDFEEEQEDSLVEQGENDTESDAVFSEGDDESDFEGAFGDEQFNDDENENNQDENFEEQDGADEQPNQEAEEKPTKMIEIDARRLSQLELNINQGCLASIRTVIKIFNSVFCEKKTTANSVVYTIPTSKLLNALLQLLLVNCAKQLRELELTPENRVIFLNYVKGICEYLNKLENEAALAFLLSKLKDIYPLFLAFKTVNKKLTKTIIDIWGRSQLFSTKFHAYVIIKAMIEMNDNDAKKFIFQKLLSSHIKYASNLTWRTYTNFIFMTNCVADAVYLEMEISYVVIFDKLRELAEKITQISKNKVR